MKVAAYQAPLLPPGSMDGVELIQRRVRWCEAQGVSILCCPEAILGGLADDNDDPKRTALRVADGELASVLQPLASDRVTTIVGFTELADDGRLFNAAAVLDGATVAGIYRKQHPAIHRSVYSAGWDLPLFRVGELTFGILVCYDSTFRELAQSLAARGARALFVPTNNGLSGRHDPMQVAQEARSGDVATATANRIWVIRADVAGACGDRVSHGSSVIVDPLGTIVQSPRDRAADLIVADL